VTMQQLPVLDLPSGITDQKLLVIAREVAMDIFDIEQILNFTNTSASEYAEIKELPRFQSYLRSEMEAWSSALNTHERVKIKAASQIEFALPELNARLHDASEPLMSKVKLAELITKLGGMGGPPASINGDSTDRFTVTINLGEDRKLEISEKITHPVIEGEVINENE
jgi:hypothetical protein